VPTSGNPSTRKRKTSSEESSSDDELTPQTANIRTNTKKQNRRPKAVSTNNVVKTPMSDSDTEVEDLTPAQKETLSRQKNQMMKQRRCNNLINIRNEHEVFQL
jgi:hypothetical protein